MYEQLKMLLKRLRFREIFLEMNNPTELPIQDAYVKFILNNFVLNNFI